MAGAVSMCNSGFQHFAVQPADLVGQDRLADRCEGELAAHLAHCFVVGGAQGGRGQGGVADRHLWTDVLDIRVICGGAWVG